MLLTPLNPDFQAKQSLRNILGLLRNKWYSMKLQFKEQDFQVNAVQAVVDCFEGQPLKTNRFTLERSKELIKKAKQAATGVQTIDFEIEEEIGYRNSAIQLMETQMLKNIQEVQKKNDLHESQQIERPKGVKVGLQPKP